mmetsp:Transcript_66052/g.144013  ORF Transcript_66052/g.144013 Transcript_66052/m.144013 type:complete len:279 (-) Transcript_66052:416-1252(-)
MPSNRQEQSTPPLLRQGVRALASIFKSLTEVPEDPSVEAGAGGPIDAGFRHQDPALQAIAAELAEDLRNSSEVVMGIPIDDAPSKQVVGHVIIIAMSVATFYTCLFVADLLRGVYSPVDGHGRSPLWLGVLSLILELSVPLCGYCGAVYGHRRLACCFCSTNLFITMVSIMTFIHVNIRINEINGQCAEEMDAAEQSHDKASQSPCDLWFEDASERYALIVHNLMLIGLAFFSFWLGDRLFKLLSENECAAVGPPFVVGEVILPSTAASLAASDNTLA